MGWYNVLKKAMVFKQRRPWGAKTPLIKKTGVNGTIMAKVQRRQAIGKWLLMLLIVRWSPLHRHTKSCCGSGGDARTQMSITKTWTRHDCAGMIVLAFVSGHHNAGITERSLNSFLNIT